MVADPLIALEAFGCLLEHSPVVVAGSLFAFVATPDRYLLAPHWHCYSLLYSVEALPFAKLLLHVVTIVPGAMSHQCCFCSWGRETPPVVVQVPRIV